MITNQLLKHESQRVLEITLESLQPSSRNSTIYSSVVRAQGDLEQLHSLEAALFLRRWNESRCGRSNGKDARLRSVDDGGEVGDIKHAHVGDGEGTALGDDKNMSDRSIRATRT